MNDNNFNPFEQEEDEENLIDRCIKIWSSTDLEKYFMITRDELSEDERTEIDLYLIEKYYPGSSQLSDDELVKEKYYNSRHNFQFAVSIKRLIESAEQGVVLEEQTGWIYGFGGNA